MNMKAFSFFLIALLLSPCTSLSQTDPSPERIKEIRAWYKDVENRLSNCIRIPVTMFYDSDYVSGGSTEMEGYVDTTNNEIIKIVEHTYYDWAEDESSFYYHEGELFFIFSAGNTPGEMYTAEELGVSEQKLWEMGGEAKTLRYYEERYYFESDKCIQHLHKEFEVPTGEAPPLKEVDSEPFSLDDSSIPLLYNHGLKMYAQIKRQLPK